MKKIYIKENKLSLLKEENSPDCVFIDDEALTYFDKDAHAFIVMNSKDGFKIAIGEEGSTHPSIRNEIAANYMGFRTYDDFKEYIYENEEYYDDLYGELEMYIDDICNNSLYDGRYWINKEIITFWYKTPSTEKLDLILNEICEKLGVDVSNVRVVVGNHIIPYEEYNYWDDIDNDKFKPKDSKSDKELRAIHLMNQQDKRDALKDFRQNRGEIQGKKLGKMPMAQYHNLIYQEEKDIDTILENFSLEVEPNEVDLSSFEIEKSLNKEIWDENNELNSRIRLKLLDIADDFFNSLEVNFVKPIDIVLTGSLCNFNWSEFSDIDLHIIVNFDEISEKTEFVKEYFDAKKNEWNNEHKDLRIYDFPIELYVQNSNEYGISNGMYSLESNKWIKEPDINDLEPLDKVSSQKIKRIASNIMTKIDDYFDYFAECSDNYKLELLNNEIDNLLYKLKVYRQKGLEKYGESGIPNIVYKVLKRTSYLSDLWILRNQVYDKINSI